ncbi:ef hand domain protein [Lasallia pustulata]|uniref:Ef hand domain protein n=1 Tax=Lasallia pustulata TaxID=136370 RepID=A0A1W5CXD9_9LECA|nr:ef hand domain protein [Lasallia pustulata]
MFRYTTSANQVIDIPLLPGALRTIADFEHEFGLSYAEAVQARQKLEEQFLDAFFAKELPLGNALDMTDEAGQPLQNALTERGFSRENIAASMQRYSSGQLDFHPQRLLRLRERAQQRVQEIRPAQRETAPALDGAQDIPPVVNELDGRETVVDLESEHSWREEPSDDSRKEGQSLLNLLYHIAADQAKREGYVHRGVTCNSCNMMPIRGIRYRCANCIDFDLCEQCEAMQIHPKTHLFYKVRIPAPFLGNPRQAQPVWYPGKPSTLQQHLSHELNLRFCRETGFENPEVEALWDQFRCLAATEWVEDPNPFNMAIDRRTFDKCFVPNAGIRPPPPNLIYDRMFAFYDTNGDGLIGFEEFLKGLASLNNKSKDERLKRIFQGYDIDSDGYVDRKDFLRMFRAFYALNKELTRDMVSGMEEDALEGGGPRDIVLSSQPISSAFPGAIPPGERSRTGQGKTRDEYGDHVVSDDQGVVRDSGEDLGDHNEVIADAVERSRFGNVGGQLRRASESMLAPSITSPVFAFREFEMNFEDQISGEVEEELQERLERDSNHGSPEMSNAQVDGNFECSGPSIDDNWPPDYLVLEDVERALGGYLALRDVDPVDRDKVRSAAHQRIQEEGRKKRQEVREQGVREHWQRRQFYLDEENGATAPEGFEEFDDLRALKGKSRSDPQNSTLLRMASLKMILQSRFAETLLQSIEKRIAELGWKSGDNPDPALAQYFVVIVKNGMSEESLAGEIADDLLNDPPSLPEAMSFAVWLFSEVKDVETQLRQERGDFAVQSPLNSSPPSRRSRSSSKVRFQDDLTDGEYETRSNTSMPSRSIPVGERWGGYEVPEAEKDVGREILYQATQEGLNELLDPMFRKREDLAVEAVRTRAERKMWRTQISRYTSEVNNRMAAAEARRWRESLPGRARKSKTEPSPPLQDPNRDPTADITGNEQRPDEASQPSRDKEPEEHIAPAVNYPEAAEEFHSAIAAFNNADPTLEEAILHKPLEELLEESGYAAATTSTTANEYPRSRDPSSSIAAAQSEPIPDPTLPQNRPNSLSDLPTPATPSTNPTQTKKPKSTPSSRLAALNTSSDFDSSLPSSPTPPSCDRLKHLALLDRIEAEDEKRGGPGKLSLAEFEEIMKGPKGQVLRFVGAWIEMASF